MDALKPIEGAVNDVARALDGRVAVDGKSPTELLTLGLSRLRAALDKAGTSLLKRLPDGSWGSSQTVELPGLPAGTGCEKPTLELTASGFGKERVLIQAELQGCGKIVEGDASLYLFEIEERNGALDIRFDIEALARLESRLQNSLKLDRCSLVVSGESYEFACGDLDFEVVDSIVRVSGLRLSHVSSGISGAVAVEIRKKSDNSIIAQAAASITPKSGVKIESTVTP